MLLVISPAKTLDYETPLRVRRHSSADFVPQSSQLVDLMRQYKPARLGKLMNISDALAELNYERFQSWSESSTKDNARQAVFAFMGDVYGGLDAATLTPRDIDFAQQHLRILSGLYGVLRPLDLMQPYRLEMGTRVGTPHGEGLYRFWGERPARTLNEQAAALRTRWLINLASQEYFRAVDRKLLKPTVITPIFKQRKGDTYKVLSFFAKQARGLMARHIIRERLRKPDKLRDFKAAGYRYNEARSSETEYVFTRESS